MLSTQGVFWLLYSCLWLWSPRASLIRRSPWNSCLQRVDNCLKKAQGKHWQWSRAANVREPSCVSSLQAIGGRKWLSWHCKSTAGGKLCKAEVSISYSKEKVNQIRLAELVIDMQDLILSQGTQKQRNMGHRKMTLLVLKSKESWMLTKSRDKLKIAEKDEAFQSSSRILPLNMNWLWKIFCELEAIITTELLKRYRICNMWFSDVDKDW